MTSSSVPPGRLSFDTARLPVRDRIEAYREMVPSLEPSLDPATFSSNLQIYGLTDLVMIHTRVNGQLMERTPERMRRDGFENFLVNVSLTGGERGLADDRSMAVPRGAVAVCDLARPFSYDFPLRAEVFTLVVSRIALEERLGAVDDLHGLVLAPERAALMADHVAWLGAHLPLGGISAAEVNDTVLDLFAAAARPDGAVLERTRDSVARAGFSRACRFIDANLASRGLTPDRIARTAGVSRSALYRLFEPYGGVAAHVRRRRLEAARDAVLDPQDPRRLADLAQDLGFPSQALFSRQFRETFGCTPRELRGVGRAEAIDAGATAARYLDWVKGLR